ncbi:unnamed protein product [Brassica oleracea]
MIVEDERDGYTQFDVSEFQQGEDTGSSHVDLTYSTDIPTNIANMMGVRTRIRDRQMHQQLKADLVEHIWHLSTPLREANLHLDASSPSSFSFSTEFVFVIFPLAKPPAYGQGMAFVVASKTDLMAKAATSGLGLFNPGNANITENRILAVKHDTNESSEQFDESDNHVGIDINSIVSVASANATYFDATEGNNKTLLLAS